MLETKNLFFKYVKEDDDGNVVEKNVLNGINIEIEKGSFVAVLGHNGSGKSTLAKHFNAILLPCGGKVYTDTMDTSDVKNLFEIRKKAGMVFQNPDNQIVTAIVEEEVAFAPENLGIAPDEIRSRVDAALETVNMSEFARHEVSKLSGGQKQRIAIASVLATKPQIIILDEPTAMLDPKGRAEIMKTLKKLNSEQNITVVLITHYMEEAVQAGRTIVIDDGTVVFDDVPQKVFSNITALEKLGLDVPQVTKLMQKLKDAGIDVREGILTVDEAVSEIGRILGENK